MGKGEGVFDPTSDGERGEIKEKKEESGSHVPRGCNVST